ncbi:helix-turn-helix domain-containing protein [Arenibaculum sp.]|jgi:excisionase family DNA binding protein|uniref:helix-turn-helix domain-containing protein n=1 Tax=Arenibaculum sp. TaxID=2865862 RepID=UPI002E0ED6CE|nr:helix-turn-helix domain-containing protein [Arenibaculum sp.]
MQTPTFHLTKPAYSTTEVLERIPIGRTKLYDLVRTGQLKATKCGRRTLFLATDISAFLSSLPQVGGR